MWQKTIDGNWIYILNYPGRRSVNKFDKAYNMMKELREIANKYNVAIILNGQKDTVGGNK